MPGPEVTEAMTPFTRLSQLNNELDDFNLTPQGEVENLLGFPRVRVSNACDLVAFLEDELVSPELESMAPFLWMMSMRSNANISPLHRQRVKGREILVSEDPKLHLVWLPDRIFVKPIPLCLLSHTFWTKVLVSSDPLLPAAKRDRIRAAALGFLRTYHFLVKYESDFALAQTLRLVPLDVSWHRFCAFAHDLDMIMDNEVSQRYAFGELRLGRLNFYSKFVLHKYSLQHVHMSYSTYFARFYAPFLFVFGVFGTVLGALQVWLQAESLIAINWPGVGSLAQKFAVAALILTFTLVVFVVLLGLYRFVKEWQHAIRKEISRRKCRTTKRKEHSAANGV